MPYLTFTTFDCVAYSYIYYYTCCVMCIHIFVVLSHLYLDCGEVAGDLTGMIISMKKGLLPFAFSLIFFKCKSCKNQMTYNYMGSLIS